VSERPGAKPGLQDPGPRSLTELEARLQRDFELLLIPAQKQWLAEKTHARWGPLLDVVIVGAGMCGLASALALKRLGVRNMRLIDRAPAGFEGPWETFARMETLRSPPELPGPALGFANLTFRAWFEAQFGHEAWTTVARIPRRMWMDYLRWYRRVVDVPIDNEVELVDLIGDHEAVRLGLRTPDGERVLAARRVVLATGRDGLGGAHVPDLFRDLDRRYWAHTSEEIDFSGLAGKTVAVIGAGASAADNAAAALEAGAARVAMLLRRADVPRINRGMGINSAGMWHGFNRLSLWQRWSIVQHIADHAIPPPRDSMLRLSRHKNFAIIARCAPHAVSLKEGRVALDTSRGALAFDYLILATGLCIDWQRRPELARLAGHVLLWRDRFAPASAQAFEQGDDPFLGPDLEFLARRPGAAAWVERVHCFSFPAYMSHGPITGDVPAVSVGAERIATGLAARLFAEDYEANWARLIAWDTPELLGDEYALDDELGPFAARPRAKNLSFDKEGAEMNAGGEEATDVMDRLAGLAPGSVLAELRRQRADVVRHMQASDAALFCPSENGGLTRAERLAVAVRIAQLLGNGRLEEHYRARLARAAPGDPEAAQGAKLGPAPPDLFQDRWQAILAHAERVTTSPDTAQREHIDRLQALGLSPRAVVALSQVIAYVNFQSRVLAALIMLRGAP